MGTANLTIAFIVVLLLATTMWFISGILIIVLALIFLNFSLGILNVSFLEFILDWWPGILMVIGTVLVVIYFIRKVKSTSKKEADKKTAD